MSNRVAILFDTDSAKQKKTASHRNNLNKRMINWLQEKEFQDRFESSHRPNGIFLEQALDSQTSFAELSQFLPISISSRPNEEDGLGERDRWFGVNDNFLFMITCLSNSCTYLSLPDKRDNEEYQWTFLERFVDLPAPILSKITWIRNDAWGKHEQADKAKYAVFYKSPHGIICELYRALTAAEAQKLLSLLQRLPSEYDYWIDVPELLDQIWIIMRRAPNEKDKIVGRYNGRATTEESARYMSSRDTASYHVVNEKTGQKGLTFVNSAIAKE